ncbi:MAG: hypothetical protein FWD95_01975 [Nocardioidaceae bacterium]|nr:hypothetical protein [Nocardioidaceae bacterium]
MNLEDFKLYVDGELRRARPDRYGSPSDDWVKEVAARVAEEVPTFEAKRIAAETIVGQREGQATRRVNRFLKGLAGINGQYALPVDWHLYADEPVAFEYESVDADGEPCIVRVRVALRAMRPDDWRYFSQSGRVSAQHRFDAEMGMYDVADWIRVEQGQQTFADWAETVAPVSKSEAS